jgi:hypothetical protein
MDNVNKTPEPQYENNPFNIGLTGIQLLFKNAQQVGIYAAILAGLAFLLNAISSAIDVINTLNTPRVTSTTYSELPSMSISAGNEILIAALVLSFTFLIVIIAFLVGLFLNGILEYTAARLALGEKVTFKQAVAATWKNLPGYIWMNIIKTVKILLWSLLFIIPGIIMAVRYSLSGVAFFAEDKRGNAAIQRSTQITDNAWLTTFAGTGLWNIITLGMIAPIAQTGAISILYKQLRHVTDGNIQKPAAHWLSWLTLILPIALIALFVVVIVLLIIIAVAQYS